MSTQPDVQKSSTISAIWILPIVALMICCWLVYDKYTNADIEITISFEDASGIVPGKTHIITRGVQIGTITGLEPDFENKNIRVTAGIKRNIADKLGKDTLFWVVRPELSVSKITGLETILGGNYVGIQFGDDPVATTSFKGLEESPSIAQSTPGLHIQLHAKVLGSIQKGTGVYYRNISIGSIQSFELQGENGVLINAFIKPEFAHLVHEGSRFSNVSGLTITGKLPDVKIRIESFAALLKGGILLHTPSQLTSTPLAANGASFKIYEDFDSAKYGIPMTLNLPSLYDIKEGITKVIYHGVEVGQVQRINLNQEDKVISAEILIDPRAERVLREGTKFWLVEPQFSLEGIKNLDTLLSGSYISFEISEEETAPYKDVFEISPEAPPMQPLRDGKTFLLTSRSINFSQGAPVYFKNIKVGEVISSKLVDSGRRVATTVYIYTENLDLLSSKSVFWQYSGVQVAADLSGIDVNVGPLSKVVSGAVAFTTPDKLKGQKSFPAEEHQEFRLFGSFEHAVKATDNLRDPGKTFRLKVSGENTLTVGSPILHSNITIGEITGFDFKGSSQNIQAIGFVEKRYQHLVTERTRFFDASGVQVSGGLSGLSIQTGSLQSIINGGVGCFTPKDGRQKDKDSPYKLYSSFQDALYSKSSIQVFFKDLDGLKVGAKVLYKGIEIGDVEKIELGNDLSSVSATLMVEEKVLPLFRDTTKIWLETPQISLHKVKNLDAVLLGPSVAILPGKGPMRKRFNALTQSPNSLLKTGFPITLKASRLNSLTIGSPVYYRQVQVGSVVDYKLAEDHDSVEISLNIESEYRNLINMGTRFWSSTGISVDAGLFSGVTVRTESFESILIGGISFANTEKKDKRVAVPANTQFCLHQEPKDAWLK